MIARTQRRVSLGAILIHTALVFLTGGLWFIFLLVRYLVRNS